MAIKTYYLLKRYIDTSERNLPLYFENLTSTNGTVTLNAQYSDATDVECSTDNSTWTAMTASGTNYTATLPANGKLYLRATATYWNTNGVGTLISCNKRFNAGGNIMSLLYGSFFTGTETSFPDPTKQYIFASMFQNVSNLVSAEKLALPATTLADYCYSYMFQGCTALTDAPALPATTLTNYCYSYMFSGCTALTDAPALPAMTLAYYCYSYMFSGCTSLIAAPALPAMTLANSCYYQMFYTCSSLTAAPALPATTLASGCYRTMFQNCSNLNSITVGATSWDTSAANNWVTGVSATGTFTKPSGTNIPTGISGIPSGWTVVNV